MINASARTEQAIKGQIGQPAACMIESKKFSRGNNLCDYGPRHGGAGRAPWRRPHPLTVACKRTQTVDNFVKNYLDKVRGPCIHAGWNKTMRKEAENNLMKSMGCTEGSTFPARGLVPAAMNVMNHPLWSNRLCLSPRQALS